MTVNTNYGKITANKDALNYISLLAGEAANKLKRDGAGALAEDAQELSNQIYDVLSAAGFYDNVR